MSRIISLLAVIIFAAIGGYSQFGDQLTGQSSPSSSSSSAKTTDCQLNKGVVSVTLDSSEYPETADHVLDAVADGYPAVMTIDRDGADANRDASLEGIPTKDGYDRDEYPMAMSEEGGAGADVRYVPYADNRGAGSSVGSQLSEYCDGQQFKIAVR